MTLTPQHERRLLQIAIFIAACVPVFAGGTGMFLGTQWLDPQTQAGAALDSHYRYLSGLLCGLGLCFWWFIPTVEQHTGPLRALTFLVVLGGLARLTTAMVLTTPPLAMLLAIGMELLVTPLICLWQSRVARRWITKR